MKQSVDLVISGKYVITCNEQHDILEDGAIAIDAGRIVGVNTTLHVLEQFLPHEIVDLGSDIILPGFINGHTHAAMTLFRGIADDYLLHDWLTRIIFPLEKEMLSDDFVYWSTLCALLEMIRGGTTTIVDMYWHSGSVARACSDIGMRAIVGSNILHHHHELYDAQKFVADWSEKNELILPAYAPHSPGEVPLDILQKVKAYAERDDVPVLMHIAETESENLLLQKEYGLRTVPFLAAHGILNDRLIAAHGVHVDVADMEMIARSGAGVIHCPQSNMKLASGIAPVVQMLAAGCRVGIGTDSAVSNNTLDMCAEMKAATLLQRVALLDATAMTAQMALEMATIRGACAIHQEHRVGNIVVGKRADIISIGTESLHQLPAYDPISTIVYTSCSDDVRTVIIDGKIKVKDGLLTLPGTYISEVYARMQHYVARVREHLTIL